MVRGRRAFTLLELLVVIAVLGILASLLMAALSSSKEKARRTLCLNNLRQFIFVVHMYANDHQDFVPSGLSENRNPEDSHIPVISSQTRTNLIRYSGSAKMLECPGLAEPFGTPEGYYYPDYGYVIGYNYLGGHRNTPWPPFRQFLGWPSPQRITDQSSWVLVSDLNDWSPGYGKTFAPHGPGGLIAIDQDTANTSAGGATSRQIGAEGGNVGYLDGSAQWVPVEQMKVYRGSRFWGSGGCFAAW